VEIALATWFPRDFGSFSAVLRYFTGDLSILAGQAQAANPK
jgi:hypothetical protein